MSVGLADPRLAAAVRDLIDRRIEFAVRNQLPRYQYGVVEGGPDPVKRTVAVRLYGLPQPSPGFVYGTVAPRDGDHVRVFVHPRGDRYIDGILGRDVVSEIVDVVTQPPPDAAVDRARNAVVRTSTSALGSVVNSALIDLVSPTWEIDLPFTPADGNTVVLAVIIREIPATVTIPTFTDITGIIRILPPAQEFAAWWWYRTWESGDSTAIATGVTDTHTFGKRVMAWELEGNFESVIFDTVTANAVNVAVSTWGTVTPPAGADLILLGGGFLSDNVNNPHSSTPVSPAIETHDFYGSSIPPGWGGYRLIEGASGSYSVESNNINIGAGWNGYGGAVVGFVSDPANGGLEAAEEIIDGDDATYHTSALAEAVQLDLGIARRIVRVRLLIACATAGAKSYELRGANQPDFDGEVPLATLAFTSAGSFATNDVTAVWNTGVSYRYFRLVGPAETRRIHTLALYEAAPGQTIVTDPTSGAFAEIDAALQAMQDRIDALTGLDVGIALFLDHGNAGATETIDQSAALAHWITLNANCVLTFTGAVATVDGDPVECSFRLYVEQDGTGGWATTWPGSVVWPDGVAPTLDTTAGSVEVLDFTTPDGGTTWFGFHGGGSSLADHDHSASGAQGGATLSPATLNLPTAMSPAQTADGRAVWDSDDNVLTVGDGASRKTFGYLGSTTPLVESGSGSAGSGNEVALATHVHPAASGPATGGRSILLASDHATPFAFGDILQESDGSDFLYASE